MKDREFPDIDCVVIGVNCEKTLGRCIESIRASDYAAEKVHLFYVDGGSDDKSVDIARTAGVEVLSLGDAHPTPGRGRNAGWKKGSSPLIQFVDSDTVMERDWLTKGVEAINDQDVGAVQGYRVEMEPEKSVFNWLVSLEWNGPAGNADAFGGDVLIRRQILEETGGYDEILVAGEDPELSQRVRDKGWRILQLDTIMTHHDIAMFHISQYWRRAFRSGYGFAAIIDRGAGRKRRFWFTEFRRIVVRGGGFLLFLCIACCSLLLALVFSAVFWPLFVMSLLLAFFLLFIPRLFRVNAFERTMVLQQKEARIYAWHCSLVVLPDIFGVLRYFIGKALGKPLRNRSNRLRTEKSGLEEEENNKNSVKRPL